MHRPYVDSMESEEGRPDHGVPQKSEDIKDGTNLRHSIYTTFENDAEVFVENPKNPENSPVDVKRGDYPWRRNYSSY